MVRRRQGEGGSSPLARGLQLAGQEEGVEDGIIPARAGFTPRLTTRTPSRRDHPRSRGGYNSTQNYMLEQLGSSPLARGLQREPCLHHHLRRIIPARAGFTFSSCCGVARRRGHPRSRGVYISQLFEGYTSSGSSPLARGLHYFVVRRGATARIIPARARFTRGGARPRGSSPLARGLPGGAGVQPAEARIIPARAGFTPR